MIRLISNILQLILTYFVLTLVEPFRVLFPREVIAKKKAKSKPVSNRMPAPSVFRSVQKQRQMVSPSAQFVPLSSDISVTKHYVHLESDGAGEEVSPSVH